MSTGSLVADRKDSTSFWSGTGLGEDISDLSESIGKGSWVQGTLAGVGTAADAVSLVFNPVASAVGWVAGWIIEHIPPLPEMLEKLTGDADAVRAGSQTWSNISTHLNEQAESLRTTINRDMADQVGQAADAWRSQGRGLASALESMGGLAKGVSTGLSVAGVVVQIVHDMVRDAIAEAIGMFSQSVLEEVFSLGLATPAVAAQISTWVTSKVSTITHRVKDLISSFEALSKLFRKISPLASKIKSLLNKLDEIPTDAGHRAGRWINEHTGRTSHTASTTTSAAHTAGTAGTASHAGTDSASHAGTGSSSASHAETGSSSTGHAGTSSSSTGHAGTDSTSHSGTNSASHAETGSSSTGHSGTNASSTPHSGTDSTSHAETSSSSTGHAGTGSASHAETSSSSTGHAGTGSASHAETGSSSTGHAGTGSASHAETSSSSTPHSGTGSSSTGHAETDSTSSGRAETSSASHASFGADSSGSSAGTSYHGLDPVQGPVDNMASSSASSGGPTTYHGLDPITGETHQPAHTNSGAHTTQDTTTNGTHTTDDAGAPNDTGKPTSTPDTDATTHHGQNGDDPNAHGNGSGNDSHEGNHDSSDGSDSPSSDHSSDGSSSQGGEGSSEQTSPDGTIDPDKVPSPPPDPGHSAYNDTAVNEWAQNTSKATGMTPEGALGVYDYTTNDGYHTMNPALRGAPDTPIPSNVQTRIDNTLSGMNQLPEVSATTYRGTNVPDDVYTHLQTGTGEYTDKAFMSSSYNESVADNFQSGSKNSVVFEINGNSGVDVSKLSAYGGEAEILFKPGTTFSISESSLDEQNILRVKLAEK